MDNETTLVLALQLVALFSIAGALLLYLLCKIRGSGVHDFSAGYGAAKAVLITSADSAFGLQIAVHLANQGFRVFAGLKDTNHDSVPSKVIRSWQKYRESLTGPGIGTLIALPLDVTREDVLHEAVDIIRAHLPAGEDGLWAVINSSGVAYRGRLDQQDIAHWDAILRTNVVGVLRTARTFQALLRNTKGRFVTFGVPQQFDDGLVAYVATRYAVEGASKALRDEFEPLGIKVIVLNPNRLTPEMLYSQPKFQNGGDSESAKIDDVCVDVDVDGCLDFAPKVMQQKALDVIDFAVGEREPLANYRLAPHRNVFQPFAHYQFKTV